MKNWYESKTVWLAILQLIAGVVALAIGALQGQNQLDLPGVLVIGKSLLDLYMRFRTDSGIRNPLNE